MRISCVGGNRTSYFVLRTAASVVTLDRGERYVLAPAHNHEVAV